MTFPLGGIEEVKLEEVIVDPGTKSTRKVLVLEGEYGASVVLEINGELPDKLRWAADRVLTTRQDNALDEDEQDAEEGDLCPECGEKQMEDTDDCAVCPECFYSPCA